MEDNNMTMADLMPEIDKTMKRIYRGDIKKAKVVAVEESGIIANIGYHADAIISWNEYSYEEVDPSSVNAGEEFDVLVLRIDDGEGNVVVSKRRAEAEKALDTIQARFDAKERFTVKIKEVVKGGVITQLEGIRAFIPGSQLTDTYVTDLSDFVGQEIEVEIIEFDSKKRKLVLSGKAIAKEKTQAKKAERLSSLVEGEKVEGTVTKLMPYGAFVNIGGVEGLVHNTDLSWIRIKHASDVVKEGDKVEVTVLSIDAEKERIALRLKDIDADPWQLDAANIEVGQNVSGEVTKLMTFGAFVRVTDNIEGLVHISQISEKRINKPEEVLEVGQEVKVKIIEVDKEKKRVALSMTAVKEEEDQQLIDYVQEDDGATLGDVATF